MKNCLDCIHYKNPSNIRHAKVQIVKLRNVVSSNYLLSTRISYNFASFNFSLSIYLKCKIIAQFSTQMFPILTVCLIVYSENRLVDVIKTVRKLIEN